MGSPTTIHPFPELRALAEEEARAFAAAWAGEFSAAWLAWDALDPDTREKRIRTHLTLLCDLTRPASRDAVARLVAKRIGWCADEVIAACERDWSKLRALHRAAGVPEPERWEPHPPAPEALALIVRHLWPEESPDAR